MKRNLLRLEYYFHRDIVKKGFTLEKHVLWNNRITMNSEVMEFGLFYDAKNITL